MLLTRGDPSRPGHTGDAEALLVFCKLPQPGRVKTRLIPHLGKDEATALYRRLAARTFDMCRALERHSRTVTVVVDPPDATEEARRWTGGTVDVVPQSTGDLGERLASGFEGAFRRGADRVAAIGTDCPELTAPLIEQALEALLRHDAVLGPAMDGGYYLIGMRQAAREPFVGIPWSTAGVLDATRAAIARLEWSHHELPVLSDVDRIEDLRALPRTLVAELGLGASLSRDDRSGSE